MAGAPKKAMTKPIGFVLVVNPFNKLEQTARLIGVLNRMFEYPPIACHHDFGKNPIFIENCPPNVRIVRPHVNTKWGDFSCVEATISALRLLYSDEDSPEWFVFLSGSDYPIKPAKKILSDLRTGIFDGYIEHRLVSEGNLVYPPDPQNLQGWKWETWLKQCHKRYCSLRLDVWGINRYLRFSKRTFWLEHPIFTSGRIPFTDKFKCYAGEAWFCANYRCARRVIDFYDHDIRVKEHYRKTLVPEESYFHTVLANAPNLKLSQNHFRYVDWTERLSNPKILRTQDLPKLIESGAHFARKFDDNIGSGILNEIDKLIE
jgi:hypothetical protein